MTLMVSSSVRPFFYPLKTTFKVSKAEVMPLKTSEVLVREKGEKRKSSPLLDDVSSSSFNVTFFELVSITRQSKLNQ